MRYILLALVALPMSAGAATLTFDAAPQGSIFGPTYTEGGYSLTGDNFSFPQFSEFAYTTFANDGTLTLNYKGPSYTLAKSDGGAFDFTSFSLGNVNGNTDGGTLFVAFNGGDAQGYSVPNTNELQSFALNGLGINSATFSYTPGETANNTLNSYARLDNLVVNATSAVPEPATWAMMIGGVGIIGGTLRRRRRDTVAIA